jgi:signal transduction histidine kinase
VRDPARTRALLIGAGGAAIGAAGTALTNGAAPIAAGAVLGGTFGLFPARARLAAFLGAAALVAIAATSNGDGMPPVPALMMIPLAFGAARWGGMIALAPVVVAAALFAGLTHDSGVPALIVSIAPGAAGLALREREKVAGQLAERVRELEEEREAHAALSVRYERARIASELHDIVAHAISVMVVQASAGQRLAAHDPELTAEAFAAISVAARQAEEDMGRLVALLGDEGAIGPAPDLTLVEEIVARAAGSGLDVTLRLEGERDGLPADVAQAACRVVQEGLTNALRYAAGAAVAVVVRGGAGGALVVEVVNAAAGDHASLAGVGTGHGLRGLRERVDAAGGTLEAGPTPEGGWRLAARLPRWVGVTPRDDRRPQVHHRG